MSPYVLLAVFGLGFGVTTSVLNHLGGPVFSYVSKVIGSGWWWMAIAFLVSLTGRRWGVFFRTAMFLLTAVGAYYVSDHLFGTYSRGDEVRWSWLVMDVIVYFVLALAASFAFTVLGFAIRSQRAIGVLAAAAVPGWIAFDALGMHAGLVRESWADPFLMSVSLWVGVVAGVVAVGVLAICVRRWLSGFDFSGTATH